MRLDNIKIPENYLKTPPKQWKLDACREYFREFGHIDRRIVVDKNGILRDGYVGDLVFKENGITDCDVVVNSKKQIKCPDKYYLFAVHEGHQKEYAWRIPKKLLKGCRIGRFALVNTRNGMQWVRVKHIAQLAKRPRKRISDVIMFSVPVSADVAEGSDIRG